MRNLNAFADELSRVIEKQAHKARFQYVDVRDEFDGHAICTPKAVHQHAHPAALDVVRGLPR